MKQFRADLHIHTILSPCGDLEMSPINIIQRAKALCIDIIGITDHNSTLHGPLTHKIGAQQGVMVLTGAEVTTKEEVHCLAFFETDEKLTTFQEFLDDKMPNILNDKSKFGEQIVVDEDENIIDEPQKLLISALSAGIDEVESMVHHLDGLFIPAHIDRPHFSLISQLGFVPKDLKADALEIFRLSDPEVIRKQYRLPETMTIIKNSDAHFLEDLGSATSLFSLKEPTFAEIKKALLGQDDRKVVCA